MSYTITMKNVNEFTNCLGNLFISGICRKKLLYRHTKYCTKSLECIQDTKRGRGGNVAERACNWFYLTHTTTQNLSELSCRIVFECSIAQRLARN